MFSEEKSSAWNERQFNVAKRLTCISCPIGCEMTLQQERDGHWQVWGNRCKRGEIYGIKEVTNPLRMVTSTVQVLGGKEPLVPVRTKEDIPKEKIFHCMEAIRALSVAAPVEIGAVLAEDLAGTGIPLIATKTVKEA